MGDFQEEMLKDKRIQAIVDYENAKECFPEVSIGGGICYFLWNKNYNGLCTFTNILKGRSTSSERNLSEFNDIFIRKNEAIPIIRKVIIKKERTLADKGGCSSQSPFGFASTFQGTQEKVKDNDCEILSSKGWGYVERDLINKGQDTIDKYKTMISKLSCEHAGTPDKNGMYRVLSRMEILSPGQICNKSYITICASNNEQISINVYKYLRTKFVRFLILQTLVGMNLSICNFKFVPWQDFNEEWTDEKLYKKYNLTQGEINYIEGVIRPIN